MNNSIPETDNISLFPEYWQEREFYHPFHFRKGGRIGYNAIKQTIRK